MKDNTASTISLEDVSEELMIEYLCAHPEFFQRHEDLLDDLTIPHPLHGNVVSLIERQVERLRQQHQSLEREMYATIKIAAENERLFQSISTLTLALLQANALDTFIKKLTHHLKSCCAIEVANVGLPAAVFKQLASSTCEVFDLDAHMSPEMTMILKQGSAQCQPSAREVNIPLFARSDAQIGSYAIVPLSIQSRYGLLVLGAKDRSHFQKDMDTLFLNYIGKIVSQIVARLVVTD